VNHACTNWVMTYGRTPLDFAIVSSLLIMNWCDDHAVLNAKSDQQLFSFPS